MNSKINLKKMVGIAMFAALAYGVTFVFRIPVQFLTFDAKDAVLTIASFIYGPLAAIIMSLIPALIEFITISDTGPWGLLMNFASSATFAFIASFIYKYKRSFNGAILALACSIFSTVAVMTVLNVYVTPIYMGVPREAVIELLPSLIVPFNIAKTLMNAALVMLLYKPVSVALRRAGMIEGKIDLRFSRQSVITIIISVAALICAIIMFKIYG